LHDQPQRAAGSARWRAVSTTGGVTVLGDDGRLKVDAYGGEVGSNVTIGGDLSNSSFADFSDGTAT